jgi:hypothetical protein
MLDYLIIQLVLSGLFLLDRRLSFIAMPAFLVLNTLLELAALGSIIGHASARGTLPAVRLAAAKGTTQVLTAHVACLGKEEDAAMSAVRQAARQVGMASQDRPHNDVVLAD